MTDRPLDSAPPDVPTTPPPAPGDGQLAVYGDGSHRPPPDAPTDPTWLGPAWLATVPPLLPDGVRLRGQDLASNRQVVSVDVQAGGVDAVVKGEAGARHRVRLSVEHFNEAQWDRMADALATSAVYLAALMAGELPPAALDTFASNGMDLLPGAFRDLHVTCSCGAGMPCAHVAACVIALARRLEREPLLIIALRGMNAARLLEAVRQKRAVELRGVAAAHVDPLIPSREMDERPLEACVDEFWRFDAQAAAELQDAAPPRHVPHALLRRLGPSPLKGKFPLAGLLASAYDAIADAAIELRDRCEAEAGEGTEEARG